MILEGRKEQENVNNFSFSISKLKDVWIPKLRLCSFVFFLIETGQINHIQCPH